MALLLLLLLPLPLPANDTRTVGGSSTTTGTNVGFVTAAVARGRAGGRSATIAVS